MIEDDCGGGQIVEFNDDSFLSKQPNEAAIQHMVAPASMDLPEAKYDEKPEDAQKRAPRSSQRRSDLRSDGVLGLTSLRTDAIGKNALWLVSLIYDSKRRQGPLIKNDSKKIGCFEFGECRSALVKSI